MILEEGNNLVNNLDTGVSTPLRIPNLLWVAPSIGDEIVDIKHCVCMNCLVSCSLTYLKDENRQAPEVSVAGEEP